MVAVEHRGGGHVRCAVLSPRSKTRCPAGREGRELRGAPVAQAQRRAGLPGERPAEPCGLPIRAGRHGLQAAAGRIHGAVLLQQVADARRGQRVLDVAHHVGGVGGLGGRRAGRAEGPCCSGYGHASSGQDGGRPGGRHGPGRDPPLLLMPVRLDRESRRDPDAAGESLHRPAQLLLNVRAHRALSLSRSLSAPGAVPLSSRSLCSPREAEALTEPTEQPRTSAVSASLSCSQ